MKLGIVSLEADGRIKNELQDVEKLIDRKLDFAIRYISFENEFPAKSCNEMSEKNSIPVLTWEFFHPDCDQFQCPLDMILEGKLDAYIEEFAKNAKLFKKRVYIRLFHEFNFAKLPWSGEKNGGQAEGPEKVKQSWIHVVNKFKAAGADNVKWIWCAHDASDFPNQYDWNSVANYWPGEEYVDVMGMDGFNFYPQNPERENPGFMSFDDLFCDLYKEMQSLSEKEMMIMTGSAEFNMQSAVSCKAEWIHDMFRNIKESYKKITYLGWFHFTFNENANWKIDSSKESLEAFTRNVKEYEVQNI